MADVARGRADGRQQQRAVPAQAIPHTTAPPRPGGGSPPEVTPARATPRKAASSRAGSGFISLRNTLSPPVAVTHPGSGTATAATRVPPL